MPRKCCEDDNGRAMNPDAKLQGFGAHESISNEMHKYKS